MDLFAAAGVAAPAGHHARYPAAPGYRQTDTSKAAAKSLDDASLLRRRVLACFNFHKDLTADECAIFVGEDKLSIRPRFTELKLSGEIEDTGTRRRNESGRSAIVWRRKATH